MCVGGLSNFIQITKQRMWGGGRDGDEAGESTKTLFENVIMIVTILYAIFYNCSQRAQGIPDL